jgi:acylphosphatase
MTDQSAAIRAVVHGRVQGVGFRGYVESRARFLRLSGYVRNLEDMRSVEVLAEGPRETLEQLIDHLHVGPSMSRVDRVEVEWREATGKFGSFGTAY